MQKKQTGILSLLLTITTYLWLVIVIFEVAVKGVVVETYEQALAYVSEGGILFTLNYANAALITLLATILFAALYLSLREEMPFWSLIGLIFVPVYSVLNLFSYLSQITLIPRLLALGPEGEPLAAMLVQLWPGSLVAVLNSLAYALLGIPSLIYGVGLFRRGGMARAAGVLIALNGAAAILGFIGVMVGSAALNQGVFLSGVLFALGLIPLTISFLKPGS